MNTPNENNKPISIWAILSLILVFIIIMMSSLYFAGVSDSPGFLTLIGTIITGVITGGVGLFKIFISYKNNKNESQNELIKNICDAKLNKAQENLLIKQYDFNQKTTEFLIDSFIKIEESLSTIRQNIDLTKKELTEKIDSINHDVIKLKGMIDDSNTAKDKHDKWMIEINRDWDGCKKRIQMIDNKILISAAGIIKESFLEFFESVISMNMAHCDDISSKELLLGKMYEKLDNCTLNCHLQLQQLLKGGEEDILVYYEESIKQSIFNYKTNMEKCFIDNAINNIFRNFYNYSSVFLNEILNVLVKSYFKHKEDIKVKNERNG